MWILVGSIVARYFLSFNIFIIGYVTHYLVVSHSRLMGMYVFVMLIYLCTVSPEIVSCSFLFFLWLVSILYYTRTQTNACNILLFGLSFFLSLFDYSIHDQIYYYISYRQIKEFLSTDICITKHVVVYIWN